MNQSTIPWLFFGFSGRISRLPFALGGLLMGVSLAFVLYRLFVAEEAGSGIEFWSTMLMIVSIPLLWCQAALGAKRLHDLGRPGLWAASLFVPYLNVFIFITLCALPGQQHPNQFGSNPNAPR